MRHTIWSHVIDGTYSIRETLDRLWAVMRFVSGKGDGLKLMALCRDLESAKHAKGWLERTDACE